MEKTWKPVAGGICSIVAGAWGILAGSTLCVVGLCGPMMHMDRLPMRFLSLFGWPALVFGFMAIIGGVFAIRRQKWGLALAGAICAVLIPPPFILGILAIVFVALAHDEFERNSSPETSETDAE